MFTKIRDLIKLYQKYITDPDSAKWHYRRLLILTILMVVFGTLFRENDLYNHPQFTEWSEIENFKEIVNHKWPWYYLFFITDAIWAATLLSALYRLLHSMFSKLLDEDQNRESQAKLTMLNLLFWLAFSAYVSDLLEGVLYTTQSFSLIPAWNVVEIKTGLYAITGLCFLFGVYKYWSMRPLAGKKGEYKRYHWKSLRVFFSTAYLSIVLVLVLILLGALPQGYTMIVDLIAKPVNLLGFFILLFVLAIVASHYPAYLEARKFLKSDNIYWHLERRLKFLPVGIIYYSFIDEDDGSPTAKLTWVQGSKSKGFSRLSKTLRYHLGTAVFVAFLYVLGYAGSSIFEDFWFTKQWAWGILFAGIWLQNTLNDWDKVKDKNGNKIMGSEEVKANAQARRMAVFKYSGYTSIGLIIATVLLSAFSNYGWNFWSLNLTIATTISLMVTYISFRWVRRQLLNDYATEKDINEARKGNAKEHYAEKWQAIDKPKKVKSTRKLVNIINLFSLIGLAFLFYINFNLYWAEEHTSAVNVIILYVFNFYGIIIITSKLALLADTKAFANKPFYSFVRYAAPIVLPALLIFSFFIPELYRSKLHYLEKRPENRSELVSLNDFNSDYHQRLTSKTAKTQNPIMFTSYGGGLMADVWVMLVLQDLQERTNGDFLKYTYNLSGNSGGGVGIANYTSLTFNHDEPLNHRSWDDVIEEVGSFNHLSLDLTQLLGRDLIRKFIKYRSDSVIDRNRYSMSRYGQMTKDDSAHSYYKMTFRQYWSKGYRTKENMYPSITVSATKVHDGGLSNAFSLYTDKHEAIFHGIQNNLDIRRHNSDSSLIFYDAVSLTNRFPILSSAASIGGQGHFIDGGAYDNSGMMNSLELATYSFERHSANFINIFNDTYAYIAAMFPNLKDTLIKENASGEFASLLGAGVAIDRTAAYLDAKIEDYANARVKIVLPRIITYDQVISYLGGKPIGKLDEIMEKIKSLNDETRGVLKEADYDLDKWGVVQAPLARLLSKPAFRYERAMLKHPFVMAQLESIESWFRE